MPDEVYEVVSQAARYWFLFLMALIVWRSFHWLRRDRRQRKKRMRLLPDAGYVGEMVVLRGSDELPEGLALPVSGEGVLGCLRGDDLYVPVNGVAKRHFWYEFDEDNGLRVQPYRHYDVLVDGESCTGRRSHTYLTHGSRLAVGDAMLRLRMFAGFEKAGVRYAAMNEPAEAPPIPDAAMQPQPTAAPVTFTAEQVAQLQRMQWAAWQAQQEAAASGGVLSTDEGDFSVPPKTAGRGAILTDEPEDDGDEPDMRAVPEEHPRASARLRRAPLPPLAADAPAENRRADARDGGDPYESDAYPFDDGFYPPVADDEPTAFEEDFDESEPYPPYPEDEADFEIGDDPKAAETNEAEAPKSLYVEPDEAAEAKRVLWDKYLKGGRRREP